MKTLATLLCFLVIVVPLDAQSIRQIGPNLYVPYGVRGVAAAPELYSSSNPRADEAVWVVQPQIPFGNGNQTGNDNGKIPGSFDYAPPAPLRMAPGWVREGLRGDAGTMRMGRYLEGIETLDFQRPARRCSSGRWRWL